jgi:hypothetical protein
MHPRPGFEDFSVQFELALAVGDPFQKEATVFWRSP